MPPITHPVIAIDYGDARIGVAASDVVGIMAHPVETIARYNTDAIKRIGEIIQQRKATALIIGLPIRQDGSEGTAAEKVRAFAQKIATEYPQLPLYFCDETFTTVTAAEKLRQAGHKAKAQKSIIDQAAAVEILQQWLDMNDPR